MAEILVALIFVAEIEGVWIFVAAWIFVAETVVAMIPVALIFVAEIEEY